MRILFVFLFGFQPIFSFAGYPFKLSGTVPAYLNGQTLELVISDSYSENKYSIKKRMVIQNGRFFFTGEINKPCEDASLFIRNTNCLFQFVVDSGINHIKFLPPQVNSKLYKNKFSNAVVNQTKSAKVKKAIDSTVNFYYQSYGKPSKEYKHIIVLDVNKNEQLFDSELNILQQYSDSYYSLIHLYKASLQLSVDINKLFKVYENFDIELKNSNLGVELFDNLLKTKSIQIGQRIQVIEIKDTTEVSITNRVMHGRIYLLAFGATWCKPCIENFKHLKELYAKYNNYGFEILYVSIDSNIVKWKNLIKNNDLRWLNTYEGYTWSQSKIVKQFNLRAIPFYLLVNKEGYIVYNIFEVKDFDLLQLEMYIKSVL